MRITQAKRPARTPKATTTVAIDLDTHARALAVTEQNGQAVGFFCNKAVLKAVEKEEARLRLNGHAA